MELMARLLISVVISFYGWDWLGSVESNTQMLEVYNLLNLWIVKVVKPFSPTLGFGGFRGSLRESRRKNLHNLHGGIGTGTPDNTCQTISSLISMLVLHTTVKDPAPGVILLIY
jgi:hypothetical protein